VGRVPHRPVSAAAKSAMILGLYVAAGLAAAAVVFARLPGLLPMATVSLLLVAAFVVGQQLVWYSWWAQLGGFFAAAVFVVCTFLAAHSSVLAWHGNRVEAVVRDVAAVHGPRQSETYLYVLVDADERRIPGHLSEDSPEFDVGEEVTVVVDRRNWVDPETTGEVDAARPLWLAALIGLVLTVVMSVLGGRSRGTGQPPRHGPGGIWIFKR
jgi:hypothetical protein